MSWPIPQPSSAAFVPPAPMSLHYPAHRLSDNSPHYLAAPTHPQVSPHPSSFSQPPMMRHQSSPQSMAGHDSHRQADYPPPGANYYQPHHSSSSVQSPFQYHEASQYSSSYSPVFHSHASPNSQFARPPQPSDFALAQRLQQQQQQSAHPQQQESFQLQAAMARERMMQPARSSYPNSPHHSMTLPMNFNPANAVQNQPRLMQRTPSADGYTGYPNASPSPIQPPPGLGSFSPFPSSGNQAPLPAAPMDDRDVMSALNSIMASDSTNKVRMSANAPRSTHNQHHSFDANANCDVFASSVSDFNNDAVYTPQSNKLSAAQQRAISAPQHVQQQKPVAGAPPPGLPFSPSLKQSMSPVIGPPPSAHSHQPMMSNFGGSSSFDFSSFLSSMSPPPDVENEGGDVLASFPSMPAIAKEETNIRSEVHINRQRSNGSISSTLPPTPSVLPHPPTPLPLQSAPAAYKPTQSSPSSSGSAIKRSGAPALSSSLNTITRFAVGPPNNETVGFINVRDTARRGRASNITNRRPSGGRSSHHENEDADGFIKVEHRRHHGHHSPNQPHAQSPHREKTMGVSPPFQPLSPSSHAHSHSTAFSQLPTRLLPGSKMMTDPRIASLYTRLSEDDPETGESRVVYELNTEL